MSDMQDVVHYITVNKAQDIHISDKNKWQALQNYWDTQNYNVFHKFIQDNQEQLQSKLNNAELINNLTDVFYNLELNDDPAFKQDRIQVSLFPPVLNEGEVYYQITFRPSENVALDYVTLDTDALSATVTPTYNFVEAFCFQNNEQVLVDWTYDTSTDTVTFTVIESPTEPIVCCVSSLNLSAGGYTDDGTISDSGNINITGSLVRINFYEVDGTNRNAVLVDSTMRNWDSASTGYITCTFNESISPNTLTYVYTSFSGTPIGTKVNHILEIGETQQLLEINGNLYNFCAFDNQTNLVLTDTTQRGNGLLYSINDPIFNDLMCLLRYD